MVIECAYDAAGLRTQKKVTENGITTTTDYFLHGKLLMHLTQGNDELHFYYDAQSRPQMLKYNGNYYSYQHNLQGDILAIVDSTGTKVVEYRYDAWGKPIGQPTTLSSSATPIGTAVALSKLNPFRYRGYVYDEETGLYYLRSRYYNPEWGRFVNEDSIMGHAKTLFSSNSFCYCMNKPTRYSDCEGKEFYTENGDVDYLKMYGYAWDLSVKEISVIGRAIEMEIGVGPGVGYKREIIGVGSAGAYAGSDVLRFKLEDGRPSFDQALVVDLDAMIGKYWGFEYSFRKPRDPQAPLLDIPVEQSLAIGRGGGSTELDDDVKIGYGRADSLYVVGYHASVSINTSKYNRETNIKCTQSLGQILWKALNTHDPIRALPNRNRIRILFGLPTIS